MSTLQDGSPKNTQNHNRAVHTTFTSNKNNRTNSRPNIETWRTAAPNETHISHEEEGEGHQKAEVPNTRDANRSPYLPDSGTPYYMMPVCTEIEHNIEPNMFMNLHMNLTRKKRRGRRGKKEGGGRTGQKGHKLVTIIVMASVLMETTRRIQSWFLTETKLSPATVATPRTQDNQQNVAGRRAPTWILSYKSYPGSHGYCTEPVPPEEGRSITCAGASSYRSQKYPTVHAAQQQNKDTTQQQRKLRADQHNGRYTCTWHYVTHWVTHTQDTRTVYTSASLSTGRWSSHAT